MPNIALLNYCNLNCPYCFANTFISENKQQNMTLENFNYILNFLFKNNEFKKIGIIGGEPTLHPLFSNFLNLLKKIHKNTIVVFTNGIELGQYVDIFEKNIEALININSPNSMTQDLYKKLIQSLDIFFKENKMNLLHFGINLYPEMKDYSFIFDFCEKYNKTEIRCSYVAPTKSFKTKNKEEYYKNGKELFLNFVKDCKNKNLRINLDCNHIPYCYFTASEKLLMKNVVSGWHNTCEPVIDITPNLEATSCFGNYTTIPIESFMDYDDLFKFFEITNNMKRKINNNNETCKRCGAFQDLSCQGGCLSFV